MKRIAVIGAGLAGLTLGLFLKDKADIHIFEKSRGVGGRMATRRAEPYFFDHGAQYFTARTPEFQTFLQPMIDSGVVKRWDALAATIDGENITALKNWADDEPRYVGAPGMKSLAKYLAQDLDIQLNTRIVKLSREQKWVLHDDAGSLHQNFDQVIFTTPAPQAAELLPSDFKYAPLVQASEMLPCFTLMLGFSETLPINYQAAFIANSDLSWLAVNAHKPGRDPNYPSLLVNSSASYASDNVNKDRDAIMEHLCDLTGRLLGVSCQNADSKSLHFWRYARNAETPDLPVLWDDDLNIGVCGDWCMGGRVEGAFRSAHILSERLER